MKHTELRKLIREEIKMEYRSMKSRLQHWDEPDNEWETQGPHTRKPFSHKPTTFRPENGDHQETMDVIRNILDPYVSKGYVPNMEDFQDGISWELEHGNIYGDLDPIIKSNLENAMFSDSWYLAYKNSIK